MTHTSTLKSHAVPIIAFFLALTLATIAQEAQPKPDVTQRDLWDSNLLNKRPVGKEKKLPRTQDDAFVGVTVWRLRPSVPSDDSTVRSLIQEDKQTSEWTPVRVMANTPLHEGDKVRISIETARTGYLYVIDCDEYRDGSRADPYLIFPTLMIRSGNNLVGAGTLVEIPGGNDTPTYFTVRRSRPDQSSELLSILVSPKTIDGLAIGRHRLRLDVHQVEAWKREWEASSHRLEAPEQAGKPYTLAEKNAASGAEMLTQDDPLPQTMYHVDAKPGEPLMIELPLQVSD